ncbi:hypothetical protein T440DRAFT_487832 [Plenodomus tracheiphilus IPT5]|uniref:Uncharacterized protein n=1 Tax=Plenodomus tracheiphilus IPT5 TaxID=1408161 RepID=A0A6A7BBW8_9PLEO|nr:hypothetical protein T440DRAFT_487832 [Plenodomus tracheiphilus IPT5]
MMTGKRDRDDDSESDFDEERDVKKSRSAYDARFNYAANKHTSPANLPYRPSFTPSPPRNFVKNGSITPAYSEHGAGPDSPAPTAGESVSHSQSSGMDFEMDMDEDDSDIRSQPPESPALGTVHNFMRPAMLKPSLFNSDSANNTGRVPTPIHPTFKRGGMNGGYPLGGSITAMNTSNSILNSHVLSTQLPPVWKGQRQEADNDRNRRMPSPISEDEDVPDTPTAFTQSQLSRLSFSNANQADQMDTEQTPISLGLPPTPRGRKRSGALTGVGRFSMGYRDDCDKCRQRVPGHYSHFLA